MDKKDMKNGAEGCRTKVLGWFLVLDLGGRGCGCKGNCIVRKVGGSAE